MVACPLPLRRNVHLDLAVPAGARVQPGVDLSYRMRMIGAVRDVTLLRLEHDDCQLREPLNRDWDTSHHVLDVRKAFNFLNGCDVPR